MSYLGERKGCKHPWCAMDEKISSAYNDHEKVADAMAEGLAAWSGGGKFAMRNTSRAALKNGSDGLVADPDFDSQHRRGHKRMNNNWGSMR